MDINTIANNSPAPLPVSSSGTTSSSLIGQSVDASKDQFLQLLVDQIKNQDPLNPLTNEQFIGQLAQFTGIEEQQKTTAAIQQLAQLQAATASISQLSEASNFLGKKVDYLDPTTGDSKSGVVTSVGVDQGAVVVKIGTTSVPLILITDVKNADSNGSGGSNS